MHIPDGFLSTPVWVALDAICVPAAGYLSRRAQRDTDESTGPLLGVMGAFVFAAQMVNFPVGVGTSGHLIGAALLAYTLGPAPAAVVMTAILALQALIFQDGGILALGANVFNMAIVGVAAAWLPYRLWSQGRGRKPAIFLGAFLSVLIAGSLALAELLLSGVRVPAGILSVTLGVFAVTGLIEGAITVAVIEAMNRLHPGWVRNPRGEGKRALGLLGLAGLLLATFGALLASALPDGLEKFAEDAGIAGRARNLIETPLADYELRFLDGWELGPALAGAVGLLLAGALCLLVARAMLRRRRV